MQSLQLKSRYSAEHAHSASAQRASGGITWTSVPVCSLEDIGGLKASLDRIDWSDGGSVLFQTSGWLSAAAEAVLARSNVEIWVLLAADGEAPVGAIAFAISHVAGIRVARMLGDPLSQYSDILLSDAVSCRFSHDALREALTLLPDVDVFLFRRVRDDAKIRKLIREMGGEQIATSAAPYADLTRYPDFEGYLKASWKAHRNRNRLRRRAGQDGELTLEITGASARASQLTRHAIRLKREWLRSRFRVFGTLNSPQWCHALISSVEYPASSTQPIVTALHARGKPAAIEIGFARRGRYYAFLGAFDPEFADWSPTDLLMEDTLRWCFDNGIEIYDLLPPNDPYKGKWTNGATPVSDWMLHRSSLGRIYGEIRGRYLPPLVNGMYFAGASVCGFVRRSLTIGRARPQR